MAQDDFNLINQSGAQFRSDLNNQLAAIVSNSSGLLEPATTFAYQWWTDTTLGVLKQRNAANTGWITIGTLASTNLGLALVTGSASQVFSVATATSEAHAVPLSQTVGRNKYVNGAYQVSQVNVDASHTITAGAAINYGIDQWYTQCTGQNITAQRIAGTAPFKYAYKLSAGATGPTTTLHGQRIEGKNVAYLENGNVAVKVNIVGDVARTVTWTAYYATVEDTFSTKTQIATGSISATATNATYQFTFNAGANAKNGIAIEYTTGALTNSTGYVTYEGHQLESGVVSSAYEHKKYSDELIQCQKTVEIGTTRFDSYVTTGQAYSQNITYKVTKRSIVTPVVTNSSVVNFNATPNVQGTYIDSFNVYHLSTATAAANFVDTWIARADL